MDNVISLFLSTCFEHPVKQKVTMKIMPDKNMFFFISKRLKVYVGYYLCFFGSSICCCKDLIAAISFSSLSVATFMQV